MALLPVGRVLSVDAWRRRRRSVAWVRDADAAPLWPLWLLRVQVCLVYLASGISKLVDPDWFGGLVLWDRVVRYQHVLDPTPLPGWAIDLLTSRWLYYVVGPGGRAHRAVRRRRSLVRRAPDSPPSGSPSSSTS